MKVSTKNGVIVSVILLGILLRLILWSIIPVTTDAGEHYSKARFIGDNLRIPVFEPATGNDPFWYPPLFHLLSAILYRLTGMLDLLPLLSGILALYFFHVFVREFYPRTLPYSIVLMSFLPFASYMSGIGYVTILMFLWGVLAFLFYKRYCMKASGRRELVLTIFFSAAACLTHYHGFLLPAVIGFDMILRRDMKFLVFFACVILLASPWYVRNHMVFGNPVWPLFYEGKYEHAKTHSGYGVEGVSNFFKPSTYTSVFFDFWIGAPNSGEDVMDNISTGRSLFPGIFEAGLIMWLILILIWSGLSLYGAGLFTFSGDRLFLLSYLFSLSVIPFLANARLIVFSVPFIVIACSEAIRTWKRFIKVLLTVLSILVFSGCTVAYAYTYNSIIDDYLPFYSLMSERLPEDARVIMPYTLQECLYYTGLECVRLRDIPQGVPPEILFHHPAKLPEYNITHVCCESLYWPSRTEDEKRACLGFEGDVVVDYSSGSVWGKCYRVV